FRSFGLLFGNKSHAALDSAEFVGCRRLVSFRARRSSPTLTLVIGCCRVRRSTPLAGTVSVRVRNGVVAQMDSRTVALIRTTFKAVAAEEDGPERLARAFYAILFANYPPIRDLFSASMDLQRDRLVNAIAYALDQLEEPDELVPFLSQLGRDHRKYGVRGEHYVAVAASLKSAVRQFAGTEMWTDEVDRAWDEGLRLISDTMLGAAQQESSPAVWTGRVVENRQVLRNLAVVRLRLDQPMEYAAGQYMSVQIPSRPRMWRYLSPAVPANPHGDIEFHIRSIMGGWVSPAMVTQTQIGDQWLLGSPLGGLGVARNAKRKMLMVGCGTGIAPLRAQLLEMAQRR